LARPRIHIEPGTRWDHLVYLGEAEAHSDGKRRVRCLCEACGNETTLRYDALQSHRYKSCGCRQKDQSHNFFNEIFGNYLLPGGFRRKSNPDDWPVWLRTWVHEQEELERQQQKERQEAKDTLKNRNKNHFQESPLEPRDIRLKHKLEQMTVANGCTEAEASNAAEMLYRLREVMNK
jgi:hypothetical protein